MEKARCEGWGDNEKAGFSNGGWQLLIDYLFEPRCLFGWHILPVAFMEFALGLCCEF